MRDWSSWRVKQGKEVELARFAAHEDGNVSVERVLALRGCAEASDATRLVLKALAASVHLSGAFRFDAMRMASQGETSRLLTTTVSALEEEGRRRLAMKALSGLGER